MILEISGNLFDHKHQAYAHGVNALGVMDAGIAVQFKQRYLKMFEAYQKQCRSGMLKPGDVFFFQQLSAPAVFNLVTQADLSAARTEFLEAAVEQMYLQAKEKNIIDIGAPLIGCGHGGLTHSQLRAALKPFSDATTLHITLYHL